MRLTALFIAAFAALVFASPAIAQPHMHNGSLMNIEVSGGDMIIRYLVPRRGMQEQGVMGDEVLFSGKIIAGIAYGTAYIFKGGCPPAPYRVSGRFDEGGLILKGKAPFFQRGTCHIAGYRSSGENNTLIFTPTE